MSTKQMQRAGIVIGAIMAGVAGLASLAAAGAPGQQATATQAVGSPTGFDAPEGFVPPPLHPKGVVLETRRLAPGVFALVSNRPAVDNSGFIVGERGVLVIDAHINGAMARQIQKAVRAITAKPILYLVNTNHHGDHTFGNCAFPAATTIIAHRATAARMRHFEDEKQFMLATVDGDTSVYADARLRLPDLVFDRGVDVDLGGRTIHIRHFGPGNTQGDTVVYEPRSKTAWTGNLVVGKGTIPPLFEGGAADYLRTVARFRSELDVRTIVPGHGKIASGAILGRYLAYLGALIDRVGAAASDGNGLEATLAALPIEQFHPLPEELAATPWARFLAGLHRLNVQQTYRDLARR